MCSEALDVNGETKAPLLRSQLGDLTPKNVMTPANVFKGLKRAEDGDGILHPAALCRL